MKSNVWKRCALVGVTLLLHFALAQEGKEAPLITETDTPSEEQSKLGKFENRSEVSSVNASNEKVNETKANGVAEFGSGGVEAAKKEGELLPAEVGDDDGGKTSAVPPVDEVDAEEDRAKFVFIKGYSTQTHTIVSFSTSTVPLTCFAGYSPVTPSACMGKRRRRSIQRLKKIATVSSSEVESSQDLSSTLEVQTSDKGKKFFTVWTKSFTTTTLTSISTDSATTLSLSYYCSAGNIDIPNIGC